MYNDAVMQDGLSAIIEEPQPLHQWPKSYLFHIVSHRWKNKSLYLWHLCLPRDGILLHVLSFGTHEFNI